MKVYRVKPGTSPQIDGTLVLRVLLQAVILGLMFGWSAYRLRHIPDANRLYLGLGIGMVLILVAGVAINWYRAKVALESYTLVITGDRIRRKMRHSPVLEISADQIRQVRKAANGTLTIRTTQGMMNELYVPFQVEGIEEVEAWLNQFATIDDEPTGALVKSLPTLSPVVITILMGIVFLSGNLVLVAICSVPLLGLLIWAAVQMHHSQNVGTWVRVLAYMIYPVILLMALMIYAKVRILFT